MKTIASCLTIACTLLLFSTQSHAVTLWQGEAPLATGQSEADIPTLTPYLVDSDKATGVGVIVCPGGGYGGLAMDHEGQQIAEWLNGHGINAFILKYRHAPGYKMPVPLYDAQRAIRLVRHNATEWGITEGKLGIIGFSAGGHLTSMTGTWFQNAKGDPDDPIDAISARPDFLILGYPVISMREPHLHRGSRRNLLGLKSEPEPGTKEHDEMQIKSDMLSTYLRVTKDTPPTFLFHSSEDKVVPPQNSTLFYNALIAKGVLAELHIFEKGRHGLGLARSTPGLRNWPTLCILWLTTCGFLTK